MNLTTDEARRAARVLRADLPDLSHGQALEIVAHQLGHRDRNTAAARLAGGTGTAVPILRMRDVPSAHEFYVDYLGCTAEWELSTKDYPRQRPGVDEHAPGGPTMAVTDPFANVIRFCQAVHP